MKNNIHGGNIYKKAKELGWDENRIMDYSANISPLGIPDHIRKAMTEAIGGTVNYPDPDCTELREAIAKQDGVSPEYITCGNGGADLLYRMAFGLKPGKALLPAPSFAEYEEALKAAGTQIVYEALDDRFRIREDITERITEDIDLVILCNPNNPTGILTERKQVLRVIEKAQEMRCMVMVDECFLEICREEKEYTVKPFIRQFPNLMILKSFTKLYAIPGVRLGYMISGSKETIHKMNSAGQAWAVSHIAQRAGLAAMERPEYKEAVIRTVEEEREYIKKALLAFPLELYDGKANYLFFRTPGMTDLDKRLETKGIMIRNCSNYVNLSGGYWRIAVKSHEENEKLLAALQEVFSL